MRLLFTYFVPSGGVETINRFRAQALRQVGIESHLPYLTDGAGRQNIRDIPYFFTNREEEFQAILDAYRYDAIVCVCDHLMLQRLRGLGYAGPLLYEAQGLGGRAQANGTLHGASLCWIPALFSYRPAPWITPSNAPVLAWVGRIERNKNWLLFLQIAAILVERYPLLQLK